MGTNWHESYFATSHHDDTASQLYQHTFTGRVGTNQHELYTRSIFTITFLFLEILTIVMRVVVSQQFQIKESPL